MEPGASKGSLVIPNEPWNVQMDSGLGHPNVAWVGRPHGMWDVQRGDSPAAGQSIARDMRAQVSSRTHAARHVVHDEYLI